MAKYLFVYRGSVPSTPPSPAEIQASFQKWGEWIGKFTQSGQIIDPGDGLDQSGKVVRLKGIVSDGPYVESKEVVGGYSIVQADDYDQAVNVPLSTRAEAWKSVNLRDIWTIDPYMGPGLIHGRGLPTELNSRRATVLLHA